MSTLPVKVGTAPARCLPDVEQFWALEKRVNNLEEANVPHIAPSLTKIVVGAAYGALLAFGVAVSLVAFAVATVGLFV